MKIRSSKVGSVPGVNPLAGALAQAGFLALAFCAPASATMTAAPPTPALADVAPAMLYIAQSSSGYGGLHTSGGGSAGKSQSGTTGKAGTPNPPVQPQNRGSVTPKPEPQRDGRDSTR